MQISKTVYTGHLRTLNTHLRSGMQIVTDAPIDNKGKGEAFSPTDMVATALCACIFTIAGQVAKEHGFSIDGATASTTKFMAQNPLRRIAEIIVDFDFSMCNLDEKQRKFIEKVPALCPVSLSLHPDIKQTINFKFE